MKTYVCSISVIVPTYNNADTILSAIDSVVKQDIKLQIEIIIVNDGSTDKTEFIVKEFISTCSKSNREFIVISQDNAGVASARNEGIKKAKGDWIAFLDSDDVWLADKLCKQFSVINKLSDVFFIGSNTVKSVYPFFGKRHHQIFDLNARELIFHWYPPTSSVLIHRDVLMKTGFFQAGKRHGEDCDLWLRCLMHHKLYIVNEGLVDFGHGKNPWGESGLSADLQKMHIGELEILHNAFLRKQISKYEYVLFKLWLKIKYLRRCLVCLIHKVIRK
jgi:glycosyltransferase involved in cell wall biosynthesis